ncbi:MAG: hypothetical protein LUC93_10680 [Planctomycetaceae bacterium]|nr:hypothetical protein [Planctomycetaceae bacterium]
MRAKAGANPDTDVPVNPLLYVPSHPARVIQADLEKAGVSIATAKGKLEFHACTKAYINLVIATGAGIIPAFNAVFDNGGIRRGS